MGVEGNRSLLPCGGWPALFLYIGFVHNDEVVVRRMVGGLGVLLLLVKLPTIVILLGIWGGHPLHGPVEITCLVLGVGSILAARFLHS